MQKDCSHKVVWGMGGAGSWQKGGRMGSSLHCQPPKWDDALQRGQRSLGILHSHLYNFPFPLQWNGLIRISLHAGLWLGLKKIHHDRIFILGVPKTIESYLLILRGPHRNFPPVPKVTTGAPSIGAERKKGPLSLAPWNAHLGSAVGSGEGRGTGLSCLLLTSGSSLLSVPAPSHRNWSEMSENHAFKQGPQPRGHLDQLPLHLPGTDSDDPSTHLTAQERQAASKKTPGVRPQSQEILSV